MQVKIIGAHGGVTKNYQATSILLDDKLLIDAGSAAAALDMESQLNIENILISHSHLDHTKDLAFLSDNCFGLRKKAFEVYCHPTVRKAIKDHLFNDIIWPDFSVLPTKTNPTIHFNDLVKETTIQLGEFKVTPVHVQHPGDAFGFIIEKRNVTLLFTQDTGPTDRIWEVAKSLKNLKAIFCEVSFPNRLQNVATISDHHTPMSLHKEMEKMPPNLPIYLGHIKPHFQEEIISEVTSLNNSRLHLLYADDVRFNFN